MGCDTTVDERWVSDLGDEPLVGTVFGRSGRRVSGFKFRGARNASSRVVWCFSSQAFWKYDTRRLWRYGDEDEAGHRQDERLEPGSEAAQGRHPCECGKAFPTL